MGATQNKGKKGRALEISEHVIKGSGKGAGCHWYPLEQNGFKMRACDSVDENFIGINLEGTTEAWFNHTLEWDLRVYCGTELVGADSRVMEVKAVMECGSLGTFYSEKLKSKVVETGHRLECTVSVRPPAGDQAQPDEIVCDGDVCRKVPAGSKKGGSVSGAGAAGGAAWAVAVLGPKLLTKSGKVDTAAHLAGKKTVCLYFSAHWCPPCRGFTPQLAKSYSEYTSKGNNDVEVVFISSDQDQTSFDGYYKEMPWVAQPFGTTKPSKFKVDGIPTLIVLNGSNGAIITEDGRGRIASKGTKAFPSFA